MKNVFTKGTAGINIPGDPAASMAMVPANEDYCMLIRVAVVLGGVVAGHKIWDTSADPKMFFAVLQYRDSSDTPPEGAVAVDSIVEIWRVGDFDGQGVAGFELHEQDDAKSSWVCFVDRTVIFVIDKGSNQGRRIDRATGEWVEAGATLPMKTIEPTANFYNSAPPFLAGRIYPAVMIGQEFYVFLQGHGETEDTFTATAGGIDFALEVDGAGHVINFTAEESA